MKFSLLGLCAIAIMMLFSFMIVAPFMHTADAEIRILLHSSR